MFILSVSTLQCWLLQIFSPIRQNFFPQVTSSELGLALVPALTCLYRAVLPPAHKESIPELPHHMWHLLPLFSLMFGHPLVLMGNGESNSSHVESRSARALQVPCTRTKDAGFGTGGCKKRIVRQRDWTLWIRNIIHAILSCFSNSGYLPAWSPGFAPSRLLLLLMKLPADMDQKAAWKSNPWEQLCHESARRKRHRETSRWRNVERLPCQPWGWLVSRLLGMQCWRSLL